MLFEIIIYAFLVIVLFFCLQLFLGLVFVNKGEQSKQAIRRIGSCVVIIPAHNDESGITDTLNNIKQELGENDRMVVIADNCSDNTASICLEFGVEVLERFNKEHVGKGFALQRKPLW
jgi:cellulose synthase/poly-beta-1,6-N-acetylglucosamine synthase-like glycosyltransferase